MAEGKPEREPPIRRVPVPVATRAPTGTTNAYLVGDVLVDPAASHPDLDAAIAGDDGGDGDRDGSRVDAPAVNHVAVTHAHPDHVGAVAAYADLTGATVWAHADFSDRFETATGIAADETFRDDDAIGDADVEVIETPGHAADHVAFAVGPDLLVGDLAVAEGSVVVGAPDGDVAAYLESLGRVRDRDPRRLYPGHGPTVEDPRATVDRLIDHRLWREERVLRAVEDGARDVDDVLASAYEKDISGVEDLARATVVAHLRKLLDEGRIGDAWRERL